MVRMRLLLTKTRTLESAQRVKRRERNVSALAMGNLAEEKLRKRSWAAVEEAAPNEWNANDWAPLSLSATPRRHGINPRHDQMQK